ncbi:MAG: hypothetical protein ACRD3S_13935, partial [Terracidiphilus sp.]
MVVNGQVTRFVGNLTLGILAATGAAMLAPAQSQFHIEEASITDIQNAIRSGQTTCEDVVRAYLARAKAYNGVCTALVTRDGAPIAQATGMLRAGSILRYPTQTVPVLSLFQAYNQYA